MGDDSSLASLSDPSHVSVAEDTEMKAPDNLAARFEQMQALYYMEDGEIMRVQYSDLMALLGQRSHLDY